jgi:hypothetical protein
MKRYISTTILVIGLVFLFSCTKKEPIGPDLGVISGPVDFGNPFAVSNANPNFLNNDQIYFGATFNKETHWLITVTGNTSGAVKTFEGTGTVISVTNAMWDGTANTIPSFRAEAVTANLSFPSANPKPTPISLSITIAAPKNLNYGHVLITDFSVDKIQNVYNGNFAAVPATKWPSNFAITAVHNDIPFINPDGNQYCTDGPQGGWQPDPSNKGHNSPYLDHMIISATSVGYPTYFPLIADPSKIYFNIMVYNDVLINNTWLQVSLNEEHPRIADSIISKTLNIYPNWTGWKLVTANYFDFKSSDSTLAKNPQKISSIQLTMFTRAPQAIIDAGTNPVTVSYDHLIFSLYKPYQP